MRAHKRLMHMLREITLPVPEDIYRQVERVATETQRDVIDVLLDIISSEFAPYPENPNRAAMKQEIAGYKKMHPDLAQKYLGQYVAIYQGKLVDHDVDPVALHKRVTARYPGKVVLSRKVGDDAEPILHMRSPRFER